MNNNREYRYTIRNSRVRKVISSPCAMARLSLTVVLNFMHFYLSDCEKKSIWWFLCAFLWFNGGCFIFCGCCVHSSCIKLSRSLHGKDIALDHPKVSCHSVLYVHTILHDVVALCCTLWSHSYIYIYIYIYNTGYWFLLLNITHAFKYMHIPFNSLQWRHFAT